MTNDRKRFTALHELAHLILPKHALDEEKASDRFAGAFLFPNQSVFEEFGDKRTKISIEELNHIKLKYGISISGTIFRLSQLGIITPAMNRRFWIKNRSVKFDEKCEYKKRLQTTRFENLLAHAYSEELISLSKLSELSGLSVDEALKRLHNAELIMKECGFKNMSLFLPPAWALNNESTEVILNHNYSIILTNKIIFPNGSSEKIINKEYTWYLKKEYVNIYLMKAEIDYYYSSADNIPFYISIHPQTVTYGGGLEFLDKFLNETAKY